MPAPGNKPPSIRRVRTYPNTPVKEHLRKFPPASVTGPSLHPLARQLWDAAVVLPHTVDWDAAEWALLGHAIVMADSYYRSMKRGEGSTSTASEFRRILESLGFSEDARQKLWIVYADPEDSQDDGDASTGDVAVGQSSPLRVVNFRR